MNQLINREQELEYLEEKYREPSSQFIILYGRRRIGKTFLLTHFIKDKPHVYFLCEKTTERMNLLKLAERASILLKVESFKRIPFRDFEDLFTEFTKQLKTKERVVIVLDEFPYLVELNPGISSVFQRIWDLNLSKRKDIMLILCGSSIGMMESLLSYRNPLYGRKTGQWKVSELSLLKLNDFFPGLTLEEMIKIYACVDGIPFYLLMFDPRRNVFQNIYNLFLRKGGQLHEEGENLLRQELREPKNYELILNAISEGNRRLSEIRNATGLDKAAVSRYLNTLKTLGIVKAELPIFAPLKAKRNLYYISDNFFNFWFRYVYPNKDKIEEGRSEEVLDFIKSDFNRYLGYVFERVVRKIIPKKSLPFSFSRIGRWWHKDKEIDLIALNEKSMRIAFFEIKWTRLRSYNRGKRILKELEEKAKHVKWKDEKRREYFGLIVKRVDPRVKEKLKGEGYLILDLLDFFE